MKYQFDTLQDVTDAVDAVDAGHTVYWRNVGYVVTEAGGDYYITCTGNRHTLGLFHLDGVTSDYKAADFFRDGHELDDCLASAGNAADLVAAVAEQMGGFDCLLESADDIANHGAAAGFNGFRDYTDTLAFARDNLAIIRAYGRELADSLGLDGFYSLVAGFNCLHDVTADDVADAVHDEYHVRHPDVLIALSWFALEEAARAVSDWQRGL